MSHVVIFDSCHDEERLQGHLERHRARGPGKALHVVALAPQLLPGGHRQLRRDGVTVDLFSAALPALVPELACRIDELHLAGVGALDTGWIRGLARLCKPGATLHAPGLTAAQTHAFEATGFRFTGAGEAICTSRKPQPQAPPPPAGRALVLGAGLAGCAIAERLAARGWDITLLERHGAPACEASGNLAGIYMPLLARDDNLSARLTRAAYLFTLRYWDHLDQPITGARCGVLALARDAAHARVQREIAARWHYPDDYARWLEPDAAGALLGRIAPDGGWHFARAGWARPATVCAAMLNACGPRLTRRFGTGTLTLRRAGGLWQALGDDGGVLAEAPVAIVANGAGALALEQTAALPLARVRGQVTHLDAATVPNLPVVLCREAYMTPAHEGVVSTGATYDDIADPLLLPSSQHENIRKARALVGDPRLAGDAPLAGRVGFRCIAPDRLPLAGALPVADEARRERLRDVPRHPGLYGLLGYASRGLIWAPYCAELLAAELQGESAPLEAKLRAALDPGRFLLAGRKHHTVP